MKRPLALLLLLVITTQGNSTCFKSSQENSTEIKEQEKSDYQLKLSDNKLEFTLDMFHRLYDKEESLFFSPHSIHQALLLAFFGSKGQTEKQLRRALRLGQVDKTEVIGAYKMDLYLQETLAKNTTKNTLKTANRLYFDKTEPIRPCIQEIFSNEIELIDFSDASSASKINEFVRNETDGRVAEVVDEGSLGRGTRVALVNTAWFKGTWEQQFKKSHTKTALFYVNSTEITPVSMMYQKGSFRHGISEELKSYIIELPYTTPGKSMYIFLPPFTPNALQTTLKHLNASTFKSAIDSLYPDSIEVLLPRFKLEKTFEISKELKRLDIDLEGGDFGDFSDKPGLGFGDAIHKAFVEVNEEGAEAAGVTALIGTRSGRPLEQTRFNCNHPFLFVVFDGGRGEVEFMGVFRGGK